MDPRHVTLVTACAHTCTPSPQSKDGVKGRFWFLESDLKDGMAIKLDKTGRSILTVLRHLGRLNEQRCTTDGGSALVFSMNAPC